MTDSPADADLQILAALFICLFTVIDCDWTPPTAQRTRTAPSSTLSDRSTSMVKST